MFSKQELDDIWQTKPYGWFSRMVKENKGKKKYTVTCTVYKYIELGNVTTTVYAKDSKTAIGSVSSQLRSKLNVDLKLPHWSDEYTYRYKVS
jgi:hypothetical protein